MEELKMIAEAINKLGDGTQTAFIIWVLSRYVLLYLLTAFGILGTVVLIYKLLSVYAKRVSFLEEIKEEAGISSDELLPYQKEKILEMIRKGKE